MAQGRSISLRRGYDIKLPGSAAQQISEVPSSNLYAVKPSDFKGLIPKLLVQEGDEVKAGQALFFDKLRPEIKVPSPVSGEIAEIVRGEKRRILEVRILADKGERKYENFGTGNPSQLGREGVIQSLLDSGAWTYVRQRPFGVIANPKDTPKAVFVSCFDSAPLAPSMEFIIQQDPENFSAGLEALSVLGAGKLHLGVRPGQQMPEGTPGTVHTFTGPHPAGNVGVQIHHIDPIRKGESVWTVHPQDVQIIGRLFNEGRYRSDRVIALAGSCVQEPQYFRMTPGQSLSTLIAGRLKNEHARIIQGNVLTGNASAADDHLYFFDNMISVIPEGDKHEFLGWLLPGFNKLSLSRTFFSWLNKDKVYDLDTNMHGEERNFVMSGEYEKVVPMNLLPVYLLKSIMARDIDRMEQLGIYEVIEEDLALCEFRCTSKIPVQQILSEGLEFLQKEV
jgi:Na+-transporting NADH:ubiquinone oxidoreductase subunit A